MLRKLRKKLSSDRMQEVAKKLVKKEKLQLNKLVRILHVAHAGGS